MTAEGKIKLINTVAKGMFDATESWDEYGKQLAYLFWAIAMGGVIDVRQDDDEAQMLKSMLQDIGLWESVLPFVEEL